MKKKSKELFRNSFQTMFRGVTSATSQKSQKLSGNKERREAFCPCANVGVFH